MPTLLINGQDLSIKDVMAVARNTTRVELGAEARARIERCRHVVEEVVRSHAIVYGVNTGVGQLCNTLISPEDIERLQRNIIYSHAVGVGAPLSETVTRATLFLSAHSLAKGFSGVRPVVVETLIAMLNKGVLPVIPEQGSVGACGDLAPLAHLTLVMMGEGEATIQGKRMRGAEALRQAAIPPLTLQAKEGLALINGTQVMTALGVQAVHDAEDLLKTAQIASAMSLEALRGTDRPFTEKMHLLRPYPGQLACAQNIRLLLEGSEILSTPRNRLQVQDAYTLRCTPQVYGASRDAIHYVRQVLTIELNAVTDNPLIFPEDREVISGGNFHGQPLALALDFLGIAVAEIGDIAERTIDRLVNPHYSDLPPFLVKKEGLNSGFMITQYTAAALVSENKVLAHPASVDSIPTSAGQEDHVSMGTIAARKARTIVRNVEQIIAIEFLCASQALEFHHPLRPGKGVQRAYEVIREHIPPLEEDRPLSTDLEKMVGLVKHRTVLQAVEEVVGPLQ